MGSPRRVSQILMEAAPCQHQAAHEIEKQFCLLRHSGPARGILSPQPVLLAANRPGTTPRRMLQALASEYQMPFLEVDVAAGCSAESILANLMKRRLDFLPGEPTGIVLLSGLERLTVQGAAQLAAALTSNETVALLHRNAVVNISPIQVFWAGAVAVPAPVRDSGSADETVGMAPDFGAGVLTLMQGLADVAQAKQQNTSFEDLMQGLRRAFPCQTWLLPMQVDDFEQLLRDDAPVSPLHELRLWCRRLGVLLSADEAVINAIALAAVRRGGMLDDLDAVVREAVEPVLPLLADPGEAVCELRLTVAAVKGLEQAELIPGPRLKMQPATVLSSDGDERFPKGVPSRVARSPASNAEIRLAREDDIAPLLGKGSPSAAGPFRDHPLVLPGFTPLVEASADGSLLKALPTQDLIIPGGINRLSTLVLGLPGSGKSKRLIERCVASALQQSEASVVVFAVQPGSRRQALAAAAHYRGPDAEVAEFNPGDVSACTHRRNPLSGITRKSQAKDAARVLSQLVIAQQGQQSGDGMYFIQHAIGMISLVILALQKIRHGHATLAEVKAVIDGGARTLMELAKHAGVDGLERFAEELAGDHRNSQTTLTQMSNILDPWDDEQVCEATAGQELDFDRLLLQKPGVLIISVDEENVSKLAGLVSLIFQNLFSWIIRTSRKSKGGSLPRQLFLFIDELPAAGRIPDLGKRLTATFRKSNVSVMAAAQCEAQLAAVYREDTASVIAGFGSRIYVPPVEMTDAEAFAKKSGMIEVTQPTTDALGRIIAMAPLNRPLVLPGELNSPNHPVLGPRILFHFAGMHPFFGYLSASWEMDDEKAIGEQAQEMDLPTKRWPKKRARKAAAPGSRRQSSSKLPPGITDTSTWTDTQVREAIERAKREQLAWDDTLGSARTWWTAFETENGRHPARVYRLVEELKNRKATITEFFLAFVHSGTDELPGVLHYLDYIRIKKREDEQKSKKNRRRKPEEPPPEFDDDTPF